MINKSIYFLTFLTIVIFSVIFINIALPRSQPVIGHSAIQDFDVDYLITLSIYRGEGLYKGFSMVYPPGRYLFQAAIFKLFGPSYPMVSVFKIATTFILYPISLFILTFFLLQKMLLSSWKKEKYVVLAAYIGALCAAALDIVFIRSAQEVHVVLALFFTALLLPGKQTKIREFIAGFLGGLVFLFRIDSGILLLVALMMAHFFVSEKNRASVFKNVRTYIVGFLVVWIPVLTATLLNGSIPNFFYDTLYLGLIMQPRVLGLPIPENELGLVFKSSLIFLLTSGGALFLNAIQLQKKTDQFIVLSFTIFASLSYVAALGRADEPHLWYGLIWVSILSIFTIYRLGIGLLKREKIAYVTVVIMGALLWAFSSMILSLKSPTIFLVGVVVFFALLYWKKPHALSVLIGGILATLLVFHSVSYLRLRKFTEIPKPIKNFSYHWLTTEEHEISGYVIAPESDVVLKKIRADIPQDEQYLFIFPENLFLIEYFQLENPTRYQLLWQTRSDRTEQEIIHQLEETKTKYFLIFPDTAEQRGGEVWKWIQNNTKVIRNYLISQDVIELRFKVKRRE